MYFYIDCNVFFPSQSFSCNCSHSFKMPFIMEWNNINSMIDKWMCLGANDWWFIQSNENKHQCELTVRLVWCFCCGEKFLDIRYTYILYSVTSLVWMTEQYMLNKLMCTPPFNKQLLNLGFCAWFHWHEALLFFLRHMESSTRHQFSPTESHLARAVAKALWMSEETVVGYL